MSPERREVAWDAVKSAIRSAATIAYLVFVVVPIFADYGLWWWSVFLWVLVAAVEAVTAGLLLTRWRLAGELARQRAIVVKLRERNAELQRLIVELDRSP